MRSAPILTFPRRAEGRDKRDLLPSPRRRGKTEMGETVQTRCVSVHPEPVEGLTPNELDLLYTQQLQMGDSFSFDSIERGAPSPSTGEGWGKDAFPSSLVHMPRPHPVHPVYPCSSPSLNGRRPE